MLSAPLTIIQFIYCAADRKGGISLDSGDLGLHIRQLCIFVINIMQLFVTVLAVSKVNRGDTVCKLKVKLKALVNILASSQGFIGLECVSSLKQRGFSPA